MAKLSYGPNVLLSLALLLLGVGAWLVLVSFSHLCAMLVTDSGGLRSTFRACVPPSHVCHTDLRFCSWLEPQHCRKMVL